MRIDFLIDNDDRRTGTLMHDINMWLVFHARAGCEMNEQDAGDLTLLTVNFHDPLDAMDFWAWRGISHRGRRS
jgi:hypothetical protein